MAALNVTPMWSKEGGSGESEKYDSFATKFSHTEGYMVEAEIGDSPEDVLATSGMSVMDIPDYGARHRSGADSFVDSKDAQPLGPIFWVVTVNYKGSRFDSNVDIEWTDSTSTEPVDRDYNGRAIQTVCLVHQRSHKPDCDIKRRGTDIFISKGSISAGYETLLSAVAHCPCSGSFDE